MNRYDEAVLQAFLKMQYDIFDEEMAANLQEAEEFLEDCFAVVCKDMREVRAYLEEEGIDICEMDDRELLESGEVFVLPDGRLLVMEV